MCGSCQQALSSVFTAGEDQDRIPTIPPAPDVADWQELYAIFFQLAEAERRQVLRKARRLLDGQRRMGELAPQRSKRKWLLELIEELSDAETYAEEELAKDEGAH